MAAEQRLTAVRAVEQPAKQIWRFQVIRLSKGGLVGPFAVLRQPLYGRKGFLIDQGLVGIP